MEGVDSYNIPSGLKNVVIESNSSDYYHKPHVNLFSSDGTQLTGYSPDDTTTVRTLVGGGTATGVRDDWWNGYTGSDIIENGRGKEFIDSASFDDSHIKNNAGESIQYNGINVNLKTSQDEYEHVETMTIDVITEDLVFLIGGHANNRCNKYDLTM